MLPEAGKIPGLRPSIFHFAPLEKKTKGCVDALFERAYLLLRLSIPRECS